MALIGSDMLPEEAADVFDAHKNKQSGLMTDRSFDLES